MKTKNSIKFTLTFLIALPNVSGSVKDTRELEGRWFVLNH
jgi:hypothetical protein